MRTEVLDIILQSPIRVDLKDMKVIQKFKALNFGPWSVCATLLFLCIIAFGIYIPGMGFYWDDWPWMYFSHILGPESLIRIDQEHRPLSGLLLWSGAKFLGEEPLGWQILTLTFRWFAGVSLFWTLTKIWPQKTERAAWIAFIFLIFPGYTHQFVSVNSSRHILPLAVFFLSLGTMASSLYNPERYRPLTSVSLILSLINMLTTEYYYGLELVRPIIIWLVIDSKNIKPARRFGTIFKYWLPYFVITLMLFIWRYSISESVNYRISIFDRLVSNPITTIMEIIRTALDTSIQATIVAWSQVLAFPTPQGFGPRKTLIFGFLVLACAVIVAGYLYNHRPDPYKKRWAREAIAVGAFSLLVGGIPFWVTGLEIKIAFPADRATLALMFGASLSIIGILDLLITPRAAKILVISMAIGLAVGAHFQTAISFLRDWDYQVAFLRQLSWRVPGLKPGTALLTQELPFRYSTDNSLVAPLNWMYAERLSDGLLPYDIFYLDLRLGSKLPNLERDSRISHNYRLLEFEGSFENVLILFHNPPGCLRVLHPEFDADYPQLPELIENALPLSNIDRIVAEPEKAVSLPTENFGYDPESNWCYYFERADLARQIGNWSQVVNLGERAFQLDDSPNHASERVPFIQGYAFTGQWEKAEALTLETIRINKFMRPMLCSVWDDIFENTGPSSERRNAIINIEEALNCPKP